MVVKKPKKKPTKKGKKKVKKKVTKKGKQKKCLSHGIFSDQELQGYINVIKKMRKNKRTKKQKKIGLTNTASFMNLLFNANNERQKKPTKNLMLRHPFTYPSMIPDYHINDIWKATKLPTSNRKKPDIVNNLNDIFHALIGYNLLKNDNNPPQRIGHPRLVGSRVLPSRPSVTPSIKRPRTLPLKPSVTPSIQYHDTSDDDSDDSSDDENEKYNKYRK